MKVYCPTLDIDLKEKRAITSDGNLIEFIEIIEIKAGPEQCKVTLYIAHNITCIIKCERLEVT